MAFVRHRGKTKLMYFRNGDTVLTAKISDGSVVTLTADSGLIRSAANDSTDRIIGVARLTLAAIDTSSWSGAPFIPVEVPVENAVEWRIDVDTTGGAADSDIGHYRGIDTEEAGDSEALFVDMSDTAVRGVFITGRESATVVFGVLVNQAWHQKVGDSGVG